MVLSGYKWSEMVNKNENKQKGMYAKQINVYIKIPTSLPNTNRIKVGNHCEYKKNRL